MKIITEEYLRSLMLNSDMLKFSVGKDTFVTPMAKEYLHDKGIALVVEETNSNGTFGKGIMSYTPATSVKDKYIEFSTGRVLDVKPEHMTHLRENILIPKNDPRILFRGKLDSLEACIMETQIIAVEEGYQKIADDLQELMEFTQHILACEVRDEIIGEFDLLGYNSEKLRYVSHNVKTEIGVQHSVPHYSMGKVCVKLNSLRTCVRETELSAANAFINGNEVSRADIIEALNRLSSCVYIIFCRQAAGKYQKV